MPSKKNEEVDIYKCPLKTNKANLKSEITIGDLHGNSMKLMFMLVKEGIAKISLDNYAKLADIYKKPADELNERDIKEFKQILNGIEFSPAAIRLIGDELADRGSNDYFTLKILEKLKEKQVAVEVIISNHSVEFLQAAEKHAANNTFQSPNLSGNLANSLKGLNTLINNGLVDANEVLKITQDVYKPNLKAISYSLNAKNSEITIFSHAPMGINVVKYLAEQFNVPYADTTALQLAESIDKINAKFQEYVQAGTINTLCPKEVMQIAGSNRKPPLVDPRPVRDSSLVSITHNPFVSIMWNRNYTASVTQRPAQQQNYNVSYVHGHDDRELPGEKHVYNLDVNNELGKNISSNLGTYNVLTTDRNPTVLEKNNDAQKSPPLMQSPKTTPSFSPKQKFEKMVANLPSINPSELLSSLKDKLNVIEQKASNVKQKVATAVAANLGKTNQHSQKSTSAVSSKSSGITNPFFTQQGKTTAAKLDEAWEIYKSPSNGALTPEQQSAKKNALDYMIYIFDIKDDFSTEKENSLNEILVPLMEKRAERKRDNPEYIPILRSGDYNLEENAKMVKATKQAQKVTIPGFIHTKEQIVAAQALNKEFKENRLLDVSDRSKSKDESFGAAFLTPEERTEHRVDIRNGLFHQAGKVYDSSGSVAHLKKGYVAFTLNTNGELSTFKHLSGKENEKGQLLFHSSMNAGVPVLAAGEMKIKDGKLISINSYSGHYEPSLYSVSRFLDYLSDRGIDISKAVVYLAAEQSDTGLKAKRVLVSGIDGDMKDWYKVKATDIVMNAHVIMNKNINSINDYLNSTKTKFYQQHINPDKMNAKIDVATAFLAEMSNTARQLKRASSVDELTTSLTHLEGIIDKYQKEHDKLSTNSGRLNQKFSAMKNEVQQVREKLKNTTDKDIEEKESLFKNSC